MRPLGLALTAALLCTLTQCRFVWVVMPDQVAAGDAFSAEVLLAADPSVNNASTPVACVALPTGWSVQGVTWDGTLAGAPIAGDGAYDAEESAFVADAFPIDDASWSCYVGIEGDYVGGDRGKAWFDIKVGTDAGRYKLWFAAGRLEYNAANQYAIALHAIAVDQPPQPLDAWSLPTTPLLAGSFEDVAFGPTGWIAVGNAGKKAVSVDGKSWGPGSIGSEDWLGIAASDDRYVIAGPTGIRHSTDGLSWTDAGVTPMPANAVEYGNGRFVAVFDGGTLHRSADGVTWDTSIEPTWGKLTDVAFDASTNRWIVCGYAGATKDTIVLTSTDGITFVPGGFNGVELDECGTGGGLFVVSGGTATETWWYTSTDGVTFTELVDHPGEVLYDAVDVDGTLVGVGRAGSIWSGGATAPFELRAARTSDIIRGVAAHGGRVVAVGDGGTILQASLGPAPVLDACTLDDGVVDESYSASIEYEPGYGTHSWTVTSGSLPPGIELVDAALTGTPTEAGTYSFEITVADAKQDSATVACDLDVSESTPEDTDPEPDTGEEPGPQDTVDSEWDPDDPGCGCASTRSTPLALVLPLLAMGLRRRVD